MTTGRINQVSKNQNFAANAGNSESQNELTFAFIASRRSMSAENSIFITDAVELGDHKNQRSKPSTQHN